MSICLNVKTCRRQFLIVTENTKEKIIKRKSQNEMQLERNIKIRKCLVSAFST